MILVYMLMIILCCCFLNMMPIHKDFKIYYVAWVSVCYSYVLLEPWTTSSPSPNIASSEEEKHEDVSAIMMPPMENTHKVAHLNDCPGVMSTDGRVPYAPSRKVITLISDDEDFIITKMKERIRKDDEDSTAETKSRKGPSKNVKKKKKNIRKSRKHTDDDDYPTGRKYRTGRRKKKNIKKRNKKKKTHTHITYTTAHDWEQHDCPPPSPLSTKKNIRSTNITS